MTKRQLDKNLEETGLRLSRIDEAASKWMISPSNGYPYSRVRFANLREAKAYFRTLAAHRLWEIRIAKDAWNCFPISIGEEQALTSWAGGQTSIIPAVIGTALREPHLTLPRCWMKVLAGHSETFGCAASCWLHKAVLEFRPQ